MDPVDFIALAMAAIASIIAGMSWWQAKKATDASESSAETAKVAAKRQIERSAVAWTVRPAQAEGTDYLRLENTGHDVAYDVRVVVNLRRKSYGRADKMSIKRGESVDIDVLEPVGLARMNSEFDPTVNRVTTPTVKFEVRVSWLSPLGVPSVSSLTYTYD